MSAHDYDGLETEFRMYFYHFLRHSFVENMYIIWGYMYVCMCIYIYIYIYIHLGGSECQESACNAGDPGLILGLGRSPGEGMATHYNILPWRIPWTEEYSML